MGQLSLVAVYHGHPGRPPREVQSCSGIFRFISGIQDLPGVAT